MVVLAASIVSRGGKPIISRQFQTLPKSRIEALLSSFPKLIPSGTQHTTIETGEVRFVWQPLEDMYVLLVTTRGSNILQDTTTLSLLHRTTLDLLRTSSPDEGLIVTHAFDLISAFDEIISFGGYRENVTVQLVRQVLEGESHEEKIQEIIARNKEAEAKEELKRRAKQLELQRRETQRRNQASGGMGGGMGGGAYGGGSGGYGGGGYTPAQQTIGREPANDYRSQSPAPSKQVPFKGSGMKLGGSKKGRGNELLDSLGAGDEELAPIPMSSATPMAPVPIPEPVLDTAILGTVDQEAVHIVIKEHLSAVLLRDGGVQSLDLRGDLDLRISDAAFAKIKLVLKDPENETIASEIQFKAHPNVGKLPTGAGRMIQLKNKDRGFPVGQGLGVLKWKVGGISEALVPLAINCWPSPNGSGGLDVNIEYELEATQLTLQSVVITIPIPEGSYPTVTACTSEWALDPRSSAITWTTEVVDGENPSGNMEFTIPGTEDVDAVFPVDVKFLSAGSLGDIEVLKAESVDGGENVVFSQETVLVTDSYKVV